MLWLRFYRRQTLATLIDGIGSACDAFGGVPRELLFDQLRSMIVEDELIAGCRTPCALPGSRQIESLHELGFVERRENVVLPGPPGVGKTHLTVSLVIAANQPQRRNQRRAAATTP